MKKSESSIWYELKLRMAAYLEKTAFPNSGMTFGDLIRETEERACSINSAGRLIPAEGETLQEQAINILAILASGNIAVPVTNRYGEKYYKGVLKSFAGDTKIYRDLAFVMFTSGTTGKPKGVMLTHENIISNLKGIESYFPVNETDRILIARPLVHIAVLTGELLYGLWRGAEICFYEAPFSAERIMKTLFEQKASVFCSTPTMFLHLVHYASDYTLDHLRLCVTSGEKLTKTAAFKIKGTFPSCAFFNVYGLTENSPRVTYLLPQYYLEKAGSVGVPLPNTELKISCGELLVHSLSVMKGYYNQDGLIDEKLRDGWLHTGDMAEKDSDGFYYILGRKDDMIIRAGLNIYPQEIEGILINMLGIQACKAYGEEDERFGEKVCLQYVGNKDVKEVRQYLLSNLPSHLMPQKIERADSLELTLSGKIKR